MNRSAERIFVALDLPEPEQALQIAENLGSRGVGFKVGLELFMAGGPGLVEKLAARHPVFLDLKYHDIPNTVAAALRVAAGLGVKMVNLHASGGSRMMEAAVEALAGVAKPPLLVAVTVLTSLSGRDLAEIGAGSEPALQVSRLARLASACGIDGVVCSPLEIEQVKQETSSRFLTVTPGVRPAGSDSGDQVRISTPAEVIRAGGDYLVVGRPVLNAADPLRALDLIIAEMEEAL